MDYEKKYKDALERARKLNSGEGVKSPSGWTVCEVIFPELKESEDEKIKKDLLCYLHTLPNHFSHNGGLVTEWIAWLEKQGDKDKLIKELGEYKVKYTQEVLEKHLNSMNNKDDERLRKTTVAFLKEFADKGYENAVECIDWLKKQGGHKLQDKTALEAANEEKVDNQNCVKPADNVEPKFKVGDWITNGATKPAQISSIEDDMYYTHNGTIGGDIESIDKDYHLWTIADTKDGDVLALSYASQNYLIIYRGLYEKSFKTIISVFCFYSVEEDTFYDETDSFHVMNTGETIKPASKEQYDTLLKAMTDAGYTFDFDKKELNKIKNKNPMLSDFFNAEYERGKADAQTPIWSEDDEKMFDYAIDMIEWYDGKHKDKSILVSDWLKSLKQRIKV